MCEWNYSPLIMTLDPQHGMCSRPVKTLRIIKRNIIERVASNPKSTLSPGFLSVKVRWMLVEVNTGGGSCSDFPKQTDTGEHLQFKYRLACKKGN